MTEESVNRGYPWPCEKCRDTLGYIHRNELDLLMENLSRVQTRDGAIILQCRKCGGLKTWFDKPEVQLKAGLRTILRSVAEESLTQQSAMMDELRETIENAGLGVEHYDAPGDNNRQRNRKVRSGKGN